MINEVNEMIITFNRSLEYFYYANDPLIIQTPVPQIQSVLYESEMLLFDEYQKVIHTYKIWYCIAKSR